MGITELHYSALVVLTLSMGLNHNQWSSVVSWHKQQYTKTSPFPHSSKISSLQFLNAMNKTKIKLEKLSELDMSYDSYYV